MTRRLAPLAAFLLLALTACGGDRRGQRIVLVTLDTLRWDSFAGSGERPSSMPHTLARAEQGLIFEQFYSATNITQPSHASMFTGLHPWELGLRRNGQVLAPEAVTVAESLQAAGWQTAAVVASFPLAARFGFDQGFDEFHEQFSLGDDRRRWEGHAVTGGGFYDTAAPVVARALDLLDRLEGHDQLLWLHFFDPHDPYGDAADEPAPSLAGMLRRAGRGEPLGDDVERARLAYEADVAHLDAALEPLYRRLEQDAERWRTWVVGASDHGESLGEGGSLGHGKRLTEEQVRVPLFLFAVGTGPESRLAPQRRSDPAGSVDVAATLLALAGLPPPPGGRDLMQPPGAGRPPGAFGMRRSFEPGRFEVRTDGSRHPLDEEVFFAVDSGGRLLRGNAAGLQQPPPGVEAEAAAAVTRLFAAFEAELEAGPQPDDDLDPQVRRALEALGYLD